MHAIQIHQAGDAKVLRYEEVAMPEPGPGMVRVKVRAAGVNHREIWLRQGQLGPLDWPVIPGSDAAGEVDAVGVGVAGWEMGQRVVINPGLGCGRCGSCLSGDQPACARFSVVEGAYAEYLVVPEKNVVPMPSGLTFVEAASIGIPFITAESGWERAHLIPGQTVVIWGASGGLGLAAVQLAKLRGARVIAVTRTPAKQDALKKHGSDEVLIWDGGQRLAGNVRDLTGGRGADVVLDSLGQATVMDSFAMTKSGGAVVMAGATTGNQAAIELGDVFRRRLSIFGVFLGGSEILPRISPLFARGQLMPVIDQVYPLEQADQAHEQLERSDVTGKVILEV